MMAGEALKPYIAEFKASPRLRWGVWGIVGILWLYGILELRDEVGRLGEAYRAVNRNFARTQSIAGQSEWTARLAEARTAQAGLEKLLWRESTVGLAQATFHDWVIQSAQQAGASRPQLTVSMQEEAAAGVAAAGAGSGSARSSSVPGLWKASARLSFDFSPQTLYALLGRIASHEKRVVVESMTIRSSPSPRAELVLVAYFQHPSGPPEGRRGQQR